MTDFLNENGVVIALVCALAAVAYGVLNTRSLLKLSPGNEKMQEISLAVQEGASAYLNRQYSSIAIVGIIVAAVLALIPELGPAVAIGFIIGGVSSAAAGYIGMNVSVRMNARVAESARGGISPALDTAFRGGAVTGMLVVGLALFGVAAYYGILTWLFDFTTRDAVDALVGLGFGGSLISVFARLGGGIFTKGADVGADIVGKIEAGIPEDDPRNPAVIADNVGDNVGDCAGMAADIFESYEVTLVASLILGFTAYGALGPRGAAIGVMFPLLVRAIGVITSIFGIYMVSPRKEGESGMKSINRGFFSSAVLSAVLVFGLTYVYFRPGGEVDWAPAWAVLIGLVLAAVIHYLT
ncbi:MAG: sodium/proton-translocating pyrophosphatase [Solirubrobacterales bacterium]